MGPTERKESCYVLPLPQVTKSWVFLYSHHCSWSLGMRCALCHPCRCPTTQSPAAFRAERSGFLCAVTSPTHVQKGTWTLTCHITIPAVAPSDKAIQVCRSLLLCKEKFHVPLRFTLDLHSCMTIGFDPRDWIW